MQAVEITIVRNGAAEGRLLDEAAQYIAQCDDNPDVDLTIACSQAQFDAQIGQLRYSGGTDETQRLAGIAFFQELISRIVGAIYPKQTAPLPENAFLHLRLVTTHKEVAQLPFELALTPAQLASPGEAVPFLLNPKLRATLTREVKRAAAPSYTWPSDPRILFAWAQPGNTVPHDEHLAAFMAVLRRWAVPLPGSPVPVPDVGHLLTPLPNASLESIGAALQKARAAGRPYTHVHLLAHGSAAADPVTGQFRLVLDDGHRGPRYVSGSELSAALTEAPGDGILAPQVVSLIACDSGNVGSPVNLAGSLAHELHAAGIPCVFASQFPLTQEGSVKLVGALYDQLLQSSDPRAALYNTRQALNAAGTHDWASLIAYAHFPADLDEQMRDVSLKIMLLFMKMSNALADHVLRNINAIPAAGIGAYFDEVTDRLNSSIDNLTGLLGATAERRFNRERHAEHYGLIGSAYKRKAEHLYRSAVHLQTSGPQSTAESTAALRQAMDWYKRGFDKLLNSHWNGTQYLSLLALLGDDAPGGEAAEAWSVCRYAAALDEQDAGSDEARAWAWGSLAELYLLQPLVCRLPAEESKAALDNALAYVKKLGGLDGQDFPKESTARQLDRYVSWWPAMLPSEAAARLAEGAGVLLGEMPAA